MKKLRKLSDSHIAAHSQRFFKTGKGEYGARLLALLILVAKYGLTHKSDEQEAIYGAYFIHQQLGFG